MLVKIPTPDAVVKYYNTCTWIEPELYILPNHYDAGFLDPQNAQDRILAIFLSLSFQGKKEV